MSRHRRWRVLVLRLRLAVRGDWRIGDGGCGLVVLLCGDMATRSVLRRPGLHLGQIGGHTLGRATILSWIDGLLGASIPLPTLRVSDVLNALRMARWCWGFHMVLLLVSGRTVLMDCGSWGRGCQVQGNTKGQRLASSKQHTLAMAGKFVHACPFVDVMYTSECWTVSLAAIQSCGAMLHNSIT